MEVQGRIFKLLPVRSGTKSNGEPWAAQDFVFEFFETQDQRTSDKVPLSVMNERIAEYDLHEGDEVRIGFGHKVREWQGRYFPEFWIYKFEKLKSAAVPQAQQAQQQAQQTQQQTQQAAQAQQGQAQQQNVPTDENGDPLPF